MARAGVRAFFLPRVRAQIAREIRAQFAAFDATGLTLDHVNAHRHFHLHPTIAALIVEAGRAHGLRAMRVPAEPAVAGIAHGIGDRLLGLWSGRLRRHLRRAGIATNDHVFGLKWSGAMTAERTRRIVDALPDGVSEIYFHPATRRTSALAAEAPGYDYEGEFAALTDAGVKQAVADRGIVLVRYGDLVSPA
jgi:hopanoid biosynthesis associated protein HpnK